MVNYWIYDCGGHQVLMADDYVIAFFKDKPSAELIVRDLKLKMLTLEELKEEK